MSDTRCIDLFTPDGMKLVGTIIPSFYTIEQIKAAMLEELGLTRINENGQPINYSLEVVGRKTPLKSDQSLQDAGVIDGDTLRLLASQPVKTTQPPSTVGAAIKNPGEIELLLYVLDLNKKKVETFATKTTVKEMLNQIIKSYQLPLKDSFGMDINYDISFKGLQIAPDANTTLEQAGVQPRSTVIINRKEMAG